MTSILLLATWMAAGPAIARYDPRRGFDPSDIPMAMILGPLWATIETDRRHLERLEATVTASSRR